MIHLKQIAIPELIGHSQFPFNIPVVKNTREFKFTSPVTILVGENGSGKSTLLESLAVAVGSPAIGGENAQWDDSLSHVRDLANTLKLVWHIKSKKGFFLRAEDFFNFVKKNQKTQRELQDDLKNLNEEYKEQNRSSYALSLAKLPYTSSLHGLKSSYGEGLHVRSHGESFMDLFQSRLTPGGLYILDEPEAPLSPTRQLALISLIKEMEQRDCQFIIATHSPILMAYPGATIFDIDQTPPRSVQFEDLEHVKLTRDFLNNPQAFLRHL